MAILDKLAERAGLSKEEKEKLISMVENPNDETEILVSIDMIQDYSAGKKR